MKFMNSVKTRINLNGQTMNSAERDISCKYRYYCDPSLREINVTFDWKVPL